MTNEPKDPTEPDPRIRVRPEWIKEQRTLNWPDMHPEDYCHRCGAKIPMWCTDRDTWVEATSEWATETGKEGICCFQCLADMLPGRPPTWWIVPVKWLAVHDAEVRRELLSWLDERLDAKELGMAAKHFNVDITHDECASIPPHNQPKGSINKYLWWHRIRFHKIQTSSDMFGTNLHYLCVTCAQYWSGRAEVWLRARADDLVQP